MEKIAQLVFDCFGDSDITFALISKDTGCIANNPDVLNTVFSNQKLLDNLCRQIDDGNEPLVTRVDDFLVAATGLSAADENIGYVIMIMPGCSLQNSAGCTNLIEIILRQISLLASQVAHNTQHTSFLSSPYDSQVLIESALN